MTKTYTKKIDELGWTFIEAVDSDKPESVTFIPIDPANSDYQEYLKSLEV
jgi:hypothetical protein